MEYSILVTGIGLAVATVQTSSLTFYLHQGCWSPASKVGLGRSPLVTFCGQARHATHEHCPSHWKTLGALPEGYKGNQPVFITQLHSGSGVGGKKFRRLHLVTKIAVDIET